MTGPDWQLYCFATPIGAIGVIWRPSPFGIRRILLPGDGSGPARAETAGEILASPQPPEPLRYVEKLIREILDGSGPSSGTPDVPWDILVWEGLTPLERAVLAETAKIPRGCVVSYQDIARRIHRPRACRFVGNSLSKNPFPLLIPCHRVIRSDKKTGGFTGDPGLKQRLIDLEKHASPLCHAGAYGND
jgi:methylated-DNA-[protein]-cysteine S-methyltransferase